MQLTVIKQSLERIQLKMYTTSFDVVNKIWSGPKSEFEIDKHENFGETILKKLNDTDTDRVMQVNIK